MSSLAFSVRRGSMASASIRLGRGARAMPLSTQLLASRHHLVAASGCGMLSNTGAGTNQRRTFFGLSSKKKTESETTDKPLRHIHIPYLPYPPQGQDSSVWTYAQVDALQEHLRRRLLDHKAAAGSQEDEPSPIVITFTPHPVFTAGLRHHENILKNTLVKKEMKMTATNNANADGDDAPTIFITVKPAVVMSPRGGLETYHGPGQLVCWPILDLRSKNLQPEAEEHSPLGVRTWAALLEGITADLFRNRYGIDATKEKANPGIWSTSMVKEEGEEGTPSIIKRQQGWCPRKIAALGVHLRRHVTSLGIALNLSSPAKPCYTLLVGNKAAGSGRKQQQIIRWFPWARITACGLPDRVASSVVGEHQINPGHRRPAVGELVGEVGSVREAAEIKAVAEEWAGKLASALGLKGGVEQCTPQDVGFNPEPMDPLVASEYARGLEETKNLAKRAEGMTEEAKEASRLSKKKKVEGKTAKAEEAAKEKQEKPVVEGEEAVAESEDPVAESDEALEKKK